MSVLIQNFLNCTKSQEMKRYKECCKAYILYNKEYTECDSVFDICYLTSKIIYKGSMKIAKYCPICGRKLTDD